MNPYELKNERPTTLVLVQDELVTLYKKRIDDAVRILEMYGDIGAQAALRALKGENR